VARQLEILGKSFDAFNAGRHEEWQAFWADDVVLHELPEIPDQDVYVGLDGVREWLANLRGVLGDSTFEPYLVEEHGDHVLVGAEARGASSGAGVPVEWRPWIVFRFRDDKIVECWGFLDEGQARAQAGAGASERDAVE
jgi:ketosteroid isomerase-like protein